MEMIEKVMSSYGIKPVKMSNISDRVYKVFDGQQHYSLKKSVLTSQTVKKWEQVFHQAHQHHIPEILSIFLTRNNSLYTVFEDEFYYLMPWIDCKPSTIEQLYRSIGNIHQQTRQFQSVDYNQMEAYFNQYNQYCDEMQKRLLTYVKHFESHIYMSPLELQVCTQYRDMELVIRNNQEQIRQLLSNQEKQKKWGYSLCHGNLRLSHSLIGMENSYMINWEQAIYDYPVTDLAILFKNELINYDAPAEMWIESFNIYMAENQLQKAELSLLLIHLLDPTMYIKNVQQYIEQTSNHSMIDQMKKIQIEHRKLLFGLQFLDYINQHYLSKLTSDLDH